MLTTAQLTSNTQLVWGRWTENRTSSLERITVPYDVAVANGRQVTVGNDFHALFRVEQGSKNLNPGLGVLGFNLSQAQATLNVAGARDLMDVYGGQLNVDIENRRFSTSLDLGHAATGKFQYQDSGLVFDSGVFNSRHGLQATAGVLSIDGKEAGYFFETTVPAGQIEGLTLWSVQP